MPGYEAQRVSCRVVFGCLFPQDEPNALIAMELLLAVQEKGAVGSVVAFRFGVKPCKWTLIGFNAKDALDHMVLWGRKGLDVGTGAYFSSVCSVCLP